MTANAKPKAFAPFASPTILLFLSSFMIGRAASDHGLDRRVAWALLSMPIVGGSVLRIDGRRATRRWTAARPAIPT